MMKISANERRTSAVVAITFLVIIMLALYLWIEPDGIALEEYNSDSVRETVGQAAHQSLMGDTMAGTGGSPASTAAEAPVRRPRGSCILITSQGGVASAAFVMAAEHAKKKSGMCLNNYADGDGLKHMPATGYSHDSESVSRRTRMSTRAANFYRVVVIFGDPIRTIESTYRRSGLNHVNRLRQNSGREAYPSNTTLLRVYEDIADSGTDVTGLVDYVTSWRNASRERDRWPEVRLLTSRMLLDNAIDHARWIGVAENALYHFGGMGFDPRLQYEAAVSVGGEELAERVVEVFRPVYELLSVLDE